MKKSLLVFLGVAMVTPLVYQPASAGVTFLGNTISLPYKQGGEGKYDRTALTGGQQGVNQPLDASSANVKADLWMYTDTVGIVMSPFGRYNSLSMGGGVGNATDVVGWAVHKLTGMSDLPDTYVLFGNIVAGNGASGLAEGWSIKRQPDGTIKIGADMGASFAGYVSNIGAYMSTDWDGVTVDSQNRPSGTWTQVIKLADFPDCWHKPFGDNPSSPGDWQTGVYAGLGVDENTCKDYNGEGGIGVGPGQHPGQGYGLYAQFQTYGWASGEFAGPSTFGLRGDGIYARGSHGAYKFNERRPTFGYIVPEPSSIIALLGGLGAFAGTMFRKRTK
jgi:hypothetical protein